MPDETITPLHSMPLPWGKDLVIQELAYESGLKMLRLRFREGRRFTIVDLDPATAAQLAEHIGGWAKQNAPADE